MLVNVEDRNDNPPRILSLGDQLTIYPDTPLNKPLMRVVAIDDDRGDKVTFDLESGNHDGSFALDSTGVLSLIRPPSSTSYSLVVSATDGGGHTTSQTLPVEVKGDGRDRSDGGGAIFKQRAVVSLEMAPPNLVKYLLTYLGGFLVHCNN